MFQGQHHFSLGALHGPVGLPVGLHGLWLPVLYPTFPWGCSNGIVKSVSPPVPFSHSVVSDSATPWTAARQASLSIIKSQSLLKLMSIELVMPSNHLILCRPLLLLPSIFPSLRVFSNESVLHIKWPKYWSFNFSISPSNEYSGLVSFRMDWLDSQESFPTPQFKSNNSSVLSFLYSPTLTSIHDHGKNHSFD